MDNLVQKYMSMWVMKFKNPDLVFRNIKDKNKND